jgi:hypothetical protein
VRWGEWTALPPRRGAPSSAGGKEPVRLEEPQSEQPLAHQCSRGYRFVCSTPVLNPTRDTTHFHLVYGTRSPAGLVVFKDAERVAMKAMEGVRAQAQHRERRSRSQQGELFGSKDMHRSGYFDHLRDRYIARSRRKVEAALRERKKIPYDMLWELALDEQMVVDSDLKHWIAEWRKQGIVAVDGLAEGQRVPHREQNHSIVWLK